MNRTKALQNEPFDAEQWQKLYYRHQQQYIRHRLKAIQLLQQGSSRAQGERTSGMLLRYLN